MANDSSRQKKPKRSNPNKPADAGKVAIPAVHKNDINQDNAVSGRLPDLPELAEESLIDKLTGLPGAMADSAFRFVSRTTDMPLKVGKALFLKQSQADMMKEAGHTLKELREVAGLTRDELSEALELKDRSLLEAVENGTATLSFELILRLAAVLARHDPVPVVLKFTRTYKPELWETAEDWGLGRWTLQFEREREFINIFRRHDAARQLSDEGFFKVLEFTRTAFEMSLHFIAEQEKVEDKELNDNQLDD
jgi:transcriptional regulator with XRE-family HTH domain